MLTGAHMVIYSTDPEADRAFFRDVLHYHMLTPDMAGSFSLCRPPRSPSTPPTRMVAMSCI